MIRRLALAALAWLALAPAALADDAAMAKLAADYDAWSLADDPFAAAQAGDRAARARLPDVTPTADARRRADLKALSARLAAIPAPGLSEARSLDRTVLDWELGLRLGALDHDARRMPFSSDGGFAETLNYAAMATVIRTSDDAEAWLARLEKLPAWYADNLANARRGVRTGFTQSAGTVEAVIARATAALAAPPAEDPLVRPLVRAHDLSPEARAAMIARGEALVTGPIRRARQDYLSFLEGDYARAARVTPGVRAIPGGEAFYRHEVRVHTTTDLTPDQIHTLGRSEVARIRGLMDGVRRETGFVGDHAAFLAFLRSDPRFHAASREDLLEKASEIAKRIDDRLPAWFATLPRLPYGVRPVPADIEAGYTTGRYMRGSPELGRAGGYLVNTYALEQRPLYELPALTAHEAVPGHHLQIALSQELSAVPRYRRELDATAFTEGWGLYAETLAGEMGVYRDAYERFGKLSYEMWRACRLVADTGIHWLGWSVAEAKRCFLENTALSPLNIDVEVARYVSWPGQALAYKVGELKILELRERARDRLGVRFDIRRFHDAVLLAGPLPLALLEARINAWIQAEAKT